MCYLYTVNIRRVIRTKINCETRYIVSGAVSRSLPKSTYMFPRRSERSQLIERWRFVRITRIFYWHRSKETRQRIQIIRVRRHCKLWEILKTAYRRLGTSFTFLLKSTCWIFERTFGLFFFWEFR